MKSFFLKIEGRFRKILFSEILYVEAYKNYVRIQTSKERFIAHYTLKQIEGSLPSTLFIKIHKSYIVAIDKISEFDCQTVYVTEAELPLSAQFSKTLRSKLNIVHSEQKIKLKVYRDGSLVSDELNHGL
jgi:two-component system, LytTR family, response regulator LytT